MDAQNAPTGPWKTADGFPQAPTAIIGYVKRSRKNVRQPQGGQISVSQGGQISLTNAKNVNQPHGTTKKNPKTSDNGPDNRQKSKNRDSPQRFWNTMVALVTELRLEPRGHAVPGFRRRPKHAVRVSLNTRAPLTLPGMLSTTGHRDRVERCHFLTFGFQPPCNP